MYRARGRWRGRCGCRDIGMYAAVEALVDVASGRGRCIGRSRSIGRSIGRGECRGNG